MTTTTFETLEHSVQANTANLRQLVNHAENMIRTAVPMLDNVCDADADFAQRVLDVETSMVLRALETGKITLIENERAQLRQNIYVRPAISQFSPAEFTLSFENSLSARSAI
ncbi:MULTISPECIES: Gp19/Gp15/Gp42 family protein [unclassified Rothia (in: high G+C Gram-positive bacteria)]|uniref:Gp19/Gp15/Gp42 family protein n=1 Tax=unclassified Rothia (in: high G+C Gram-positive bacteria) TaxID=2689056 RepID=UPI00195A54AD|nr:MULTISPECIES: Gp19/Gp15/Gp42 family protein [unclassified Rothia (in: high G+C Gram-positive bacteria)]MBM7050815.1 hypothetical protein [Rothia sp. ZJ1223]QRZ60990.1 hypothetical protein JR346_06915 [Rothia sp. ZJ932]